MTKGRLEAFTDGVMAVILTIMVLEMSVPHGPTIAALLPLWPVFMSYVLSFAYVGIYWMNHHHLLQASQNVSADVLLANLNFLFWLSLLPFTTGWMSENRFAQGPVALYGLILLLAAIAYNLLQSRIARHHDAGGLFSAALGSDLKGKGSILAYALGVGAALASAPALSLLLFGGVAIAWLIPDRRMEQVLTRCEPSDTAP